MNNEFENQLTQDARAIQSIAQSRLNSFKFDEDLLKNKTSQRFSSIKLFLPYGVAAAIAISVLSLINQPHIKLAKEKTFISSTTTILLNTNLKQFTNATEQIIEQKLIKEQNAIIKDLKTLSKNLFSI